MKVGQRIALIAFSLLMISITVVAALFMCGLFGTEAEAALISEINGSVFYTTCNCHWNYYRLGFCDDEMVEFYHKSWRRNYGS